MHFNVCRSILKEKVLDRAFFLSYWLDYVCLIMKMYKNVTLVFSFFFFFSKKRFVFLEYNWLFSWYYDFSSQ